MKCPYISRVSNLECVKMLEHKIDSQLTEFDISHFCDGNPVYCYYYRLPNHLSRSLQSITDETLKQPDEVEMQNLRTPTSNYHIPQEGSGARQQYRSWWR